MSKVIFEPVDRSDIKVGQFWISASERYEREIIGMAGGWVFYKPKGGKPRECRMASFLAWIRKHHAYQTR